MEKPWFDEEDQKQFGTGQRKQRQGEKTQEERVRMAKIRSNEERPSQTSIQRIILGNIFGEEGR